MSTEANYSFLDLTLQFDNIEDFSKAATIYKHAITNSSPGSPESVLNTIDVYCWTKLSAMNLGDVKSKVVEEQLLIHKPRVVVEVGGYIGYSAIRFAHFLTTHIDANSHVISVEVNPFYAAFSSKLIELAGLQNNVTVLIGSVSSRMNDIKNLIVEKQTHFVPSINDSPKTTADFVFLDHVKSLYVSDLQLLESNQVIGEGSLVIGDNIIYPGAPEYWEYVQNHSNYKSQLIHSKLEYTQDDDAVAVSLVLKNFE